MTHPLAFFERPAVVVAPELLGAVITHTTDAGSVAVRITEVEAYLGNGEDPGSHAHRGLTPRTAAMFGPPAHIYAYLSYGMHVCMNLVCSPDGEASGVLLRAGEVVAGHALARSRHPRARRERDLARGPGVLTRALGVTLGDYGRAIDSPPFSFRASESVVSVASGARVGVGGEAGGAAFPWRFWIPSDPSVSSYKRHPRAVG